MHVAPEYFFTRFFKSYKNIEYLSVDINPQQAMRKEDITNLSFEDSLFDIVFCAHVLEHVKDDKKAMRELYRVLKKSGFAIIDVPIDYNRESTLEDDSIKTPEERTKAFWGWNHLRLYGKDFPEKLKNAGFKVKIYTFFSTLKSDEINYLGLKKSPLYICEK